jgi:hypothetical protein
MALGDVGRGLAVQDGAAGTGWLMWSSEAVHDRFSPAPYRFSASHLVAVVWDGSNWLYDNNSRLTVFEPASDDCLVAEVDFSADSVSLLQGVDVVVNGIDSGYVSGDLVVTPNEWNGSSNAGEFGISGEELEG